MQYSSLYLQQGSGVREVKIPFAPAEVPSQHLSTSIFCPVCGEIWTRLFNPARPFFDYPRWSHCSKHFYDVVSISYFPGSILPLWNISHAMPEWLWIEEAMRCILEYMREENTPKANHMLECTVDRLLLLYPHIHSA